MILLGCRYISSSTSRGHCPPYQRSSSSEICQLSCLYTCSHSSQSEGSWQNLLFSCMHQLGLFRLKHLRIACRSNSASRSKGPVTSSKGTLCSLASNAVSRQQNAALFLWHLWKELSEETCASSTLPGNETSLWFAICLLIVHHLLRSHCGERTLLHPSASKSQLMSFSSETSSSAILAGYRKYVPVRNYPPDWKGCCTSLVLSHVTAEKWHASE